jgi:thioredoxin reductase (NADPH)
MTPYDLVIVGAGPAGLASAIAARQAGLEYVVIEKGALVNSLYNFPTNMVFFTTPELLEIGGLPFVTPYEKPTRLEALRYYRRVVEAYDLRIRLEEEVVGITRPTRGPAGENGFIIDTRSARGVRRPYHTRFIILSIGYYDHPNLLGIPGEELPHVSHYYRDPHPYFRKAVAVVGGGNSAAEAALDLYRNGARVISIHRGAGFSSSLKYWVRPDVENRIAEGAIDARFETSVAHILPTSLIVERHGHSEELPADAVLLLTGYHPDFVLFKAAGMEVDEEGCMALHDPETLETTVPGLFLAGGAISGRNKAPVFIENGRTHGEKIVKTIVARMGGGGGLSPSRRQEDLGFEQRS